MRGEVKLWQEGMNLEPYFIRVVEGECFIRMFICDVQGVQVPSGNIVFLDKNNGTLRLSKNIRKEDAERAGIKIDFEGQIVIEKT